MTNDLVTTDAASNALALARLQDSVESLYKAIERDRWGSDRLPALPSPETRRTLDRRRKDLRASLRPIAMAKAEQETARRAMGAFLGGYLNIRVENQSATVAGYVAHLGEQPLFAILAALDDFKHRRVFDIGAEGQKIPFTIDHAPSAFRLLDQVKKHAADVQEEHFRITRVLAIAKTIDGPEVSDAERERVAVHMRQLADSLAMKAANIRVEELNRAKLEADGARDRARRIIENVKRRNSELDAESQAAG